MACNSAAQDMNKLYRQLQSILQNGQHRKGIRVGQKLTKRFPTFAPGWLLLSECYRRNREAGKAVSTIKRALDIAPDESQNIAQYCQCLLGDGQLTELSKVIKRARDMVIDDIWALNILGVACFAINYHDFAIHFFNLAFKQEPQNARFLYNIAISQLILGNTEIAAQQLNEIIRKHPDYAQAYWTRSNLSRVSVDRNFISSLTRLTKDAQIKPSGMSYIYFALGKEYEDIEDFDAAFLAYKKGSDIKRSQIDFSMDHETDYFDNISSLLDESWYQQAGAGTDNMEPIFILGMPRTGTTLVDRIISQDASVLSAGELNTFSLSINRVAHLPLLEKANKKVIPAAARMDPARLGQEYISSTRFKTGATRHFTDKTPQNFLYLGLIAKALPNAKIIHVYRNPMDTCFSNYKQLFAAAGSYSYTLSETALYYLQYRKLMDHWDSFLKNRILNVSYEELATNTLECAKQIFDFCDLPWENSYAELTHSRVAVTTASVSQVRQPIYTTSIGKWKVFKKHLGEIQDILTKQAIRIPD